MGRHLETGASEMRPGKSLRYRITIAPDPRWYQSTGKRTLTHMVRLLRGDYGRDSEPAYVTDLSTLKSCHHDAKWLDRGETDAYHNPRNLRF